MEIKELQAHAKHIRRNIVKTVAGAKADIRVDLCQQWKS